MICSRVHRWCPELRHWPGIRKWKKETWGNTFTNTWRVLVMVASTDGPHLGKGVQVQMFSTWGSRNEHPHPFHTCIHANGGERFRAICPLKPHWLRSLQPKRLFKVRFLDFIQTCSNIFAAFLWLVLHSLCRFPWNPSGRFWLVLLISNQQTKQEILYITPSVKVGQISSF